MSVARDYLPVVAFVAILTPFAPAFAQTAPYNNDISGANYGRPEQSNLAALAPRTLQLGVKVSF
ncbi:MAG: hypothetical protein HOP16_10505 [Acidobacteria bacterium]|nr:hypothetical protein [Acidobacteriota bacterium]